VDTAKLKDGRNTKQKLSKVSKQRGKSFQGIQGPDKFVGPLNEKQFINTPEYRRVTKKQLLERLRMMDIRLNILFEKPLKFNPKYFKILDPKKLETLYLALYPKPIDLSKLNEHERRQLFKRLIRELKTRRLTFEEIRSLRIALGFPAKKLSKFHRHVKEAINDLVRELRRNIERSPKER